jgi:hypothetical protein
LLHPRVSSCPNPQALDKARKACWGPKLELFTNINNTRKKKGAILFKLFAVGDTRA